MQTPEALRIIGEKLRQMGVLDVIGMLSQDPPHINYSPEMDRHTAKTKTARTRRSTRPGCEWGLPVTQICARFVRGSHRGRCSYNKTKTCRGPVGAPAPGANGACPRRQSVLASCAVRTGGGAPTTKPKPPANP